MYYREGLDTEPDILYKLLRWEEIEGQESELRAQGWARALGLGTLALTTVLSYPAIRAMIRKAYNQDNKPAARSRSRSKSSHWHLSYSKSAAAP